MDQARTRTRARTVRRARYMLHGNQFTNVLLFAHPEQDSRLRRLGERRVECRVLLEAMRPLWRPVIVIGFTPFPLILIRRTHFFSFDLLTASEGVVCVGAR